MSERQNPLRMTPKSVRAAGHRGHSAGAPENTLAAFRMAHEIIKGGGRGGAGENDPNNLVVTCETDLALTLDHELILIHDETVDRTTDGHGLVRNMTYAEIASLDAGSWFDPSRRFKGERVPLLREALQLARELGGSLVFQLELKVYGRDDIILPKLKALIDELQCADLLQFSSFDFVQLRAVKKLIPDVPTVGLCHSRLIDPVAAARDADLDAFNIEIYHFPTSGEQVQKLHEAGFAVFLAVLPLDPLETLKSYGSDVEAQVVEWVRQGLVDQIVSNDVSEMVSIRNKSLLN
ncbi:hypothetical protein H2204_001552 [Knufia peltigerae]|uniref:GP-PDE domain-containing protein n=1 Tax=Knufia peltigerae TaxID=1002370 RepID=A0AA38YE24_9EURO|nr:hypothetical protein H2204_001552 [Knufia peltigerae]